MRLTSLSAAALLGATLLVPMGTATAAGETCQGQPATIVGTPGGQVVGTEGVDVIVTNGATHVDALGGDDLVCATGRHVFAILGAGADTFIDSIGGSDPVHWNNVQAGTADGTDTEADVIRVSFGTVVSGMAGQPNADIIEFARFGSVGWKGIQTAPGRVTTVEEFGSLGLQAASDVTVDARSGTVTGADTSLTYTGRFEKFGFATSTEHGRFTFRGTHGAEHVKVDAPATYDRDVALGGGKDSYESNSLGGKATRIKGDGGRNELLLDLNGHDRVRADLSRSRVTATKAGVKDAMRVRGFDDLTVTAKRVDVIGTNRANQIGVIACRTTVRGKKGRDYVYVDSEYIGGDEWWTPRCSTYKATIYGGRGHDTILGSPGNDRLIGGWGKDIVTGNNGRDVCQGERVRHCERRI